MKSSNIARASALANSLKAAENNRKDLMAIRASVGAVTIAETAGRISVRVLMSGTPQGRDVVDAAIAVIDEEIKDTKERLALLGVEVEE